MPKREPLNPALTPDTLSRTIDAFCESAGKESDLASVLLIGSYLEQCLACLLRQFFVEVCGTADFIFDHQGGMLSELISKAKIARCCGLIDETLWHNLQQVASIRNRFAHIHPEVSFDDEKIAGFCNSMIFKPTGASVDFSDPEQPIQLSLDGSDFVGRSRFTIVTTTMASTLIHLASNVKRCDFHEPLEDSGEVQADLDNE